MMINSAREAKYRTCLKIGERVPVVAYTVGDG